MYTLNIYICNSYIHIESWISPSPQLTCEYEWGHINSDNSTFTGLFLRTSSFPSQPVPHPSVSGVPWGSSYLFIIKSVPATSFTTFCVHGGEQCPTSGHSSSAGHFSRVMVIPGVLLLFHNCPRKALSPLRIDPTLSFLECSTFWLLYSLNVACCFQTQGLSHVLLPEPGNFLNEAVPSEIFVSLFST